MKNESSLLNGDSSIIWVELLYDAAETSILSSMDTFPVFPGSTPHLTRSFFEVDWYCFTLGLLFQPPKKYYKSDIILKKIRPKIRHIIDIINYCYESLLYIFALSP